MEFSKKFETDARMVQYIYCEVLYFFSLMIGFVLANNADPDEMSHYAEFHLSLHC